MLESINHNAQSPCLEVRGGDRLLIKLTANDSLSIVGTKTRSQYTLTVYECATIASRICTTTGLQTSPCMQLY
jgi:hypothetical protein